MSSTHGMADHVEAERMHHEGVRVAETLSATISTMLTDLGRANRVEMKEPVFSVIHVDRPSGDHCYALWQLVRDRGHFFIKVELHSDHAYGHLYLKAYMQSRFEDRDAKKFGAELAHATGLTVDIERTQIDGIVTYGGTHSPG